MKVYFIGAGPGAADLITIRGAEILSRAQLVMYAGSLVSEAMLSHCRANPLIVNTAKLNLDEQVEFYLQAKERDWDVARLHSGDPSIYGATAEQMRRLRELEIGYEVVPGVPSFVASAAVLETELTKPDISQTIILTRTSGRASPVPAKENRGRLGELLSEIEPRSWLLTTMLLVGQTLDENLVSESRLYAADYTHRFRRAAKNEPE
jgi:precorrin-4/cobalt-precorrin-4 C11-methyltransferase